MKSREGTLWASRACVYYLLWQPSRSIVPLFGPPVNGRSSASIPALVHQRQFRRWRIQDAAPGLALCDRVEHVTAFSGRHGLEPRQPSRCQTSKLQALPEALAGVTPVVQFVRLREVAPKTFRHGLAPRPRPVTDTAPALELRAVEV